MTEAEIEQFNTFVFIWNTLSPNVQQAVFDMFEQVQNSIIDEEETIFPKIHKN